MLYFTDQKPGNIHFSSSFQILPWDLLPIMPKTINQSLQESTIKEFNMEFRLEHGSMEVWAICSIYCGKSQKRWFSMALGKSSIFWAKNFHFWVLDFHFVILTTEIPFSECRILVHLFRAPLYFLSAECPFFSGEFWIFSTEVAFSECRILGGLFRAVFGCKICILQAQNFYFWVRNFDSLSTESWTVWLRHYVMSYHVLTSDLAISIKAIQ